MTLKSIVGAVCIFLLVVSTNVNAATFNVISGTFETFDSSGLSVAGMTSLNGNGVLVEGVYNGDASGLATDASATYAGFDTTPFMGTSLFLYFAPTGVFDAPGAPIHNAPTIDFNTMTADMTSLFANWNSNQPPSGEYYHGEFNVGGIASVTALGVNSWELSWSNLQEDGPFTGITTEMTMVISQVPLPAAVWLFGFGLMGLFGVAKRK